MGGSVLDRCTQSLVRPLPSEEDVGDTAPEVAPVSLEGGGEGRLDVAPLGGLDVFHGVRSLALVVEGRDEARLAPPIDLPDLDYGHYAKSYTFYCKVRGLFKPTWIFKICIQFVTTHMPAIFTCNCFQMLVHRTHYFSLDLIIYN